MSPRRRRWPNDSGRLKTLRLALRDALRAAPFSEGRRFAAGLERAYRLMWRRRASGEKPTPINLFIP